MLAPGVLGADDDIERMRSHYGRQTQCLGRCTRAHEDLAQRIFNGWNRIAVGFGGFVDPAAIKGIWAEAKAGA